MDPEREIITRMLSGRRSFPDELAAETGRETTVLLLGRWTSTSARMKEDVLEQVEKHEEEAAATKKGVIAAAHFRSFRCC
jgi:hypothetical protein